jgi:hypothetical protein
MRNGPNNMGNGSKNQGSGFTPIKNEHKPLYVLNCAKVIFSKKRKKASLRKGLGFFIHQNQINNIFLYIFIDLFQICMLI